MNRNINKIFKIGAAHLFWITILGMAIFSPGIVEADLLRFGQKMPETNTGIVKFYISGLEELQDGLFGNGLVIRNKILEVSKFICESGAEESGGTIEFLPFHDVNSVFVGSLNSRHGRFSTENASNQNADQATNNTNQSGNNRIVHKEPLNVEMIIAQIIGVFIGLIIGSLIVIFTQRESSPGAGFIGDPVEQLVRWILSA